MGPLVSCFQDILIHGQDIRSVRKSIGDINLDYQVFSDTSSFAPDDFRKLNYTGWRASGLTSLTLLRTLSGKPINIVNVYLATADKPTMQKRIYETLTRALNSEHDPCILVGDFNVNTKEGKQHQESA
jgi:hypothetical protein